MILVVAGSRVIRDKGLVFHHISQFIKTYTSREDVTIMHGGAKGVDSLAGAYAELMDIPTRVEEPDYTGYGDEFAPIKRNREMAQKADALLAIKVPDSSGTESMIEFAVAEGLSPIVVWTVDG